METKYFDNGFVGKKVLEANEAIMLYNAGMDIRDQDGCGFTWYDEISDGEPSENEVVSRIMDYFNDNGFVYAGFELDGKKVVNIGATSLCCDISIGQKVYFLYYGRIEYGIVTSIRMATDKSFNENIKYHLQNISYAAEHINNIKDAMNFLNTIEKLMTENNQNCVRIKIKDKVSVNIPMDLVFHSKEELVNNLLSGVK